MLNSQYAEFQQDDQTEAREHERLAIDHSIVLMECAEGEARTPADVANAILFASRLWTVLIEDLASPENGLPNDIRAQIISIGIWILREIEGIRSGQNRSFADIIMVSKAIKEGLL
ncbi:MAG: flagellar biosynthesis regulator FlaF [Hyphomicrobiaceae bacterium]|uniref:flagellar biosynthesis regulator FlaF n=1 Tax=Pseudorhodoplanes sp. TaxID=1934341 RepID=UPI003D143548